MSNTLFSSTSNEWYTPSIYVEAARKVMGRIDLDPASCGDANKTVKATHYYTREENGLAQSWHGCIWLNPPYGTTNNKSNQGLWIRRLIAEYKSQNVDQAVLLVNAGTATRWFHQLFEFPICFTEGHINFYNSTHKIDTAFSRPTTGSTHGSAFAYLGPYEQKFVEVFSAFGTVARRIGTPKPKPITLNLWDEVSA